MQERSDIVDLTGTPIEESIITQENMATEVTHQINKGTAGHNLPHQVIRLNVNHANHLVLIKTELNNQEKVSGIVM